MLDQEGGEAFEEGYCSFVSKLAGRLRDVPKLALLGLGGFKEGYAYFGGGVVMRGDARVRELRWGWICRSFNIEVHVRSLYDALPTSRLAKVLHSRV